VKTLGRVALIAVFVAESTGVTAHADTVMVTVAMTSSPNPSVVGQRVWFTINVGDWCSSGGSVLKLYDGPNFLSLVYLPNTNLGKTTSIFATTKLSVGTHQMWGVAPFCLDKYNQFVELSIANYFQVVKAKPKVPPGSNATAPAPKPRPVAKPSPSRSPSPAPSLASSARIDVPAPPAPRTFVQGAAAPTPTSPRTPGGLAVLVAVLVAAVVVGGIRFRHRRVTRA
jgi:hypothetical protein